MSVLQQPEKLGHQWYGGVSKIAEADSTSTNMHLKGPGLSDRTNSSAQLTSLKMKSCRAVHSAIENESLVSAELDSLLQSPFVMPPVAHKKRRLMTKTCSESDKRDQLVSDAPARVLYTPGAHAKRNSKTLATLNSGSLKDLRQLQTIGAKRAELILNFREQIGQFKQIDDLGAVPGFTQASVRKFCQANFIQ